MREGEITIMEALWTTIKTVITNIVELLTTVCTSLISNPIFQIMLGVALFGIVVGIVMYLVKKMRRQGK